MITNRTTINRKQKWEEKQLDGRFNKRQDNWMWLRKGNLTRETESHLIAAQNNAIRTKSTNRLDATKQQM